MIELNLSDFLWNDDKKSWWTSLKSFDFDIFVPGNEQTPDSTAVTLAKEVLGQIDDLYARANACLDEFLDRQKAHIDSEGEVISVECGFLPGMVKIEINYATDTYGLWFVKFQKTEQGGWWSFEFGRAVW